MTTTSTPSAWPFAPRELTDKERAELARERERARRSEQGKLGGTRAAAKRRAAQGYKPAGSGL